MSETIAPALGEEDSDDDDAAFARWWAHLPDFLKPDYPLDIPPARLPFVQHVFTGAGAPAHCPDLRCRRAHRCCGGDGPPCYRADRRDLSQVLFLAWAELFLDVTPEAIESELRSRGNRYRLTAADDTPVPVPGKPAAAVRRRRRSR